MAPSTSRVILVSRKSQVTQERHMSIDRRRRPVCEIGDGFISELLVDCADDIIQEVDSARGAVLEDAAIVSIYGLGKVKCGVLHLRLYRWEIIEFGALWPEYRY